MSGAARGFAGRLDLGQRQPRVIEKGATGRRQLDTLDASNEKLSADLLLQIADLAS
jgi:hypothetical protein